MVIKGGRKMKKYILLFCSIFILLLTSSCKEKDNRTPFEKFLSKVSDSITEVSNVNMDSTMKDGNVLVYQLTKEITVTKNTETNELEGSITTVEKKLGNEFVMSEDHSSSTFKGQTEESLFQYDLQESYFKELNLEDQKLEGVIAIDHASQVLGVSDMEAQSDITIVIQLESDKIKEMTLSYVSNSSKAVDMKVTYQYASGN